MKSYAIVFFLLMATQVPAQSILSTDTVSKIEQVLSRYQATNPGIQVSISRNGLLLFSKAYGMADLEHKVPLTTKSVAEAGSVSKQFTAAAVLLLEQQGKLSLEDDIRKYFPEIKNYGRPILIRHMMQHTSGLKDWGSVAGLAGWPRSTKTYSNDDALYIIGHQKTLNNQPGDEFIYSNSNYNLLAILVKRVSGMSLADFSREHLFKPAGMIHTEWRDDFRKVVLNRAIAYSKEGERYLVNMPNEYVYGNGGLLTTTEDLLRWNDYYTSGKLGSPSLLKKQVTSSRFTNGVPHNYAAGIFLEQINGLESWTHSGATAGYRANLDYFPSLHLSIAWISNTTEFDGNRLNLTNALREIFIGRANVTDTNKTVAPITSSVKKIDSYTGWFKSAASGGGVNLIVKNGALVNAASSQAMVAIADDAFSIGSRQFRFAPGREQFYSIGPARDSILFTRMRAADLTTAKMQEYLGEYYSEETESKFIVQIKDSVLVLVQAPSREFKMSPTYQDGFEAAIGACWFERDKNKKIARLKISISRARNIQFDKIK